MTNACILVVEDEGIVAFDIRATLERLGYDIVATVVSGEEGIHQAQATRPDLVLISTTLSGPIDGVEAARHICDILDIPVIYLTAYADAATFERAKGTDPFGYVLKPFEERELHTMIEAALRKHRQEPLEGKDLALNYEVLDVKEEVKEIVSLFKPFAERKGLTFFSVFSTSRLLVRLDRCGLHQIVDNLIANAVKFTHEGGIMVYVGTAEQEVFIEVQDTGIGMDEAFLSQVSNEFRQGSSWSMCSFDGNGLGLAISKRLVDLMGGSISVESKKGRGSVFRVSFPCVDPEAAKPAPLAARKDGCARSTRHPLRHASKQTRPSGQTGGRLGQAL